MFVFSKLCVTALYVYCTILVEFFPIVTCQKTNRTYCEAAFQKIPTGTHYLDTKNCTIYYCRETHIRHAEIDIYICRGIDKVLFDDLHQDCFDKGCDTGEFLHHKIKKNWKEERLKRKENQRAKKKTTQRFRL